MASVVSGLMYIKDVNKNTHQSSDLVAKHLECE